MSYQRVLPRDLFNESKLLKCLGQLALLIHDNKCGDLKVDYDGEAFDIRQEDFSGNLFCANLFFTLRDEDIYFSSSYNSKRNYPLIFTHNTEGDAFNDDGLLSEEFKVLIFGDKK